MQATTIRPPSIDIVTASIRLSEKIKRENAIYTMRLDLAHEYGLELNPQFDAMFQEAMARAQNFLFDVRPEFRNVVEALKKS